MADFTPRTLRNDRSGASLMTTCSDREAFERYLSAHGESNHWILYWIHKTVAEIPQRDSDDATDYLCDWFLYAVGRGLKRPMLRVHFKNRRFKVYLSARGTLCLKAGEIVAGQDYSAEDDDDGEATSLDPTGHEEYIGCWLRGRFLPARERMQSQPGEDGGHDPFAYQGRRRYGRGRQYHSPSSQGRNDGPERPLLPVEREFLDRLKADPIAFLAECGKDMDRCCYCNLPLEDPRSKDKGYGPICAGRWGLPWGGKKRGQKEEVKSFSERYNQECHFLCVNVRMNVEDEFAWNVLGDWLEEQGVPRTGKPKGSPRFPRWDGAAPKRPAPVPEAPPPEPIAAKPTAPLPGEEGHELLPVEADRFRWAKGNDGKTVGTASVSALGWGAFPSTVQVRSPKTGQVRAFNETSRDIKGGELALVRYRSKDGLCITITND